MAEFDFDRAKPETVRRLLEQVASLPPLALPTLQATVDELREQCGPPELSSDELDERLCTAARAYFRMLESPTVGQATHAAFERLRRLALQERPASMRTLCQLCGDQVLSSHIVQHLHQHRTGAVATRSVGEVMERAGRWCPSGTEHLLDATSDGRFCVCGWEL